MTLTGSTAILLRRVCTLFVCTVLLTGCQPAAQREAPRPAAESAVTALAPLPPLPVPNSTHYVVDGEASDVRILAFRGGPLAKVGHNHVIRVHELAGDIYLAPTFQESGFALTFPVAKLQVDPADARADEGAEFAVMPSPQAIDGTYKNMTGPALLDAQQFPEVTLQSVALTGPPWGPEATVRVTLHGVAHDLVVPLAIHSRNDELGIIGMFILKTSDFGMTPFSVLGGGLQVLDEVKVRFNIAARRK
jgi:polyisoprenoid-binding protein YceI